MFTDFAGGQISRTDYFSSRDCEEGRAWLSVHGGCWHVLIPPQFACRPTVAHARPVIDSGEWEGWRWRLEFGGHHLPLPRCQILGPRPMLSQPYTRSERTLTLCSSELKAASGQSFYGSLQLGVQIHATCRLWLVHDTRRGEKLHDQQRRLERFHQQRPGG